MRISKKILAIALSILMAVSMMPFTAFASGETEQQESSVASIKVGDVTTYYDSFEEALAACPENADSVTEIKLYKNVTVTNTVNITNGKKVRVVGAVGASYTFTSTGVDPMFLIDGGSIEFSTRISTIESTSNDCTVFRVKGAKDAPAQYSSLIIGTSTTVKGKEYGVLIPQNNHYADGVYVKVSGKIETGLACIYTNGNINQHGANPATILVNNANSKLTCTDNKDNSYHDNAAVYAAGYAVWTFSAGSVTGPTALYAKCGTFTCSGTGFSGTGEAVAYSHNGNGITATGEAIVLENCAGYSDELNFSITYGNVTSANADPFGSYAYSQGTDTRTAKTGFVGVNPSNVGPTCKSNGEAADVSEFYNAELAAKFASGNAFIEQAEIGGKEGLIRAEAPGAKVVRGGVTYYAGNVIGAANSCQPGETVVALKDLSNGSLHVLSNSDVTIDLNGHTINSTSLYPIRISDGASVTIENGTVTTTKGVSMVGDSNLVIADDCVVNANISNYDTVSSSNATVDIYGTVNGTVMPKTAGTTVNIYDGAEITAATAIEAKAGTTVNVYGGEVSGTVTETGTGNVEISGGTFDTDVTAYVVEGATQDANGEVVQTYVAKIGDNNYYESFEAALAAAQAGDTITLLDDVTLTTTNNAINKNLTIDFGTHTMTAAKWPFENYATLTLNGTTGGITSARGVVDNYGTLIINGGVYSSTTALQTPTIWNNPGGEIVMNGGTINAVNAGIYNENGTFTMNDGVINSTSSSKLTSNYSYAVRNLPGATTTMNGGTINAVHGGIAAFGNGGSDITTVVINGGTIATQNSAAGNDAFYAIYVSGNGTSVTVNDGDFSSPRAAAMLDDDDIGLTENTSLNINGGTFTSPSGVAAVALGQNSSNPAVSGGTFSSAVPAEYCAPGFVPVTEPNSQGMYEVEANTKDGMSLTLDDQVKINFYVNLDTRLAGYSEDQKKNCYVEIRGINAEEESAALINQRIYYPSLVKATDADDPAYANCYKVPYLAAPAQITEEVTITVRDSGGAQIGDSITTSVAAYCRAIIDPANGVTDTKLINLAKAMMDYGKAAADKFDAYHPTGNFDNWYFNSSDDIAEAEEAFANLPTPTITGNNVYAGFAYVATSLPALRLYLNTSSTMIADYNLKATITGFDGLPSEPVTPLYDEVLQNPCIDVTGIYGENLNKTITVKFAGSTLTITAMQYAKVTYDSEHKDSVQSNFARSLYFYNKAAAAYFG